MAKNRRCKHCHTFFCPRPQNPDQQYCSNSACQRARKRRWQQQKFRTDPDYHANQRAAQDSWKEKNPRYWQEYRARHPECVARNRERQRERNRHRRKQGDAGHVPIAKMDASAPDKSINTGRYMLSRIDSGGIAKMDALIVEINVVSSS